jgi:N-acylneuraminate cytidylyltransferase
VTPEILAVIPARGGSKGIPRKNLRLLAGKSLVARAVETARAASRIRRVVVSTDDPDIARAAREAGAETLARPPEISTDSASSESALLHCLEELRVSQNYRPDLVLLVQCTSPLTTPADLDGAVDTLLRLGADSCFTAVPFHHFLWKAGADGLASGVNHEGRRRRRRQDLDPQLLENGAAYVMRVPAFLEARDRFCGRIVAHLLPDGRSLEIDEPRDLLAAEALLRERDARLRSSLLPSPLDAVVFDFDGVMTDNSVTLSERGEESVRCDRGDGLGIGLLRERGIPMLVLSKERNPVVSLRAAKLGLEVLQGVDSKAEALRRWLAERSLRPERTVYVGNDVNDLDPMRLVGCAACPSDAHPAVRSAAHLVLDRPGGRGAVRELCDAVLDRLGPAPAPGEAPR